MPENRAKWKRDQLRFEAPAGWIDLLLPAAIIFSEEAIHDLT